MTTPLDLSPVDPVPIMDGVHRVAPIALEPHELDEFFDLRYTVTPPWPEQRGQMSVFPMIEATDDLGNEYSDAGGAYGLSPDGSYTKAVISARPPIPVRARELRVRLTFTIEVAQHVAEFVVPLGPPLDE